MNVEEKKILKERISILIVKYEKEIIETEKMTQPISPENSIGRISRMDAINNKSVMEAALRNKRGKLVKLKQAFDDIGNPSFGVCDRCDKNIKPERMMFMPESTLCVSCAR